MAEYLTQTAMCECGTLDCPLDGQVSHWRIWHASQEFKMRLDQMNITLTLRVDYESEAFCKSPSAEVARILRGVAMRIEHQGLDEGYFTLFDINGNTVGCLEISD